MLSNDDVTNFLQGLLGRAPSLVESSSTKRLTFEAQTYVVATLRQGLEQQDEAVPRRVAHAERTTRMSALQLALSESQFLENLTLHTFFLTKQLPCMNRTLLNTLSLQLASAGLLRCRAKRSLAS